jgi:hypothetical protein
MICIDFQGGAHGNYLEFVCNKIAGRTIGLPFNDAGASHNKQYIKPKLFFRDHYSFSPIPFVSKKVISIQIVPDDLLALQQISLLRAGDYGYDSDKLEINTYNKLNNNNYRWVLDQLINSFFKNQIKESYNAVKDPGWPEIDNLSDYVQLPQWIQDECKNIHNLNLLELNENNPDCPRHVLREFFQIGFSNPEQHGFIARQKQIIYPCDFDVFVFPFSCFYNMEQFLYQTQKIAHWADLVYNCQSEIEELHNEFFQKQPYRNSNTKCDNLVQQLQIDKNLMLPKLDLLEEAYINTKLGQNYFL